MRSTPTFQKVTEIYPQLLTWQNLSQMCIDAESTAEADWDGRHLAATCQPMEKKLNSSRGRRESGGGLNSSRRTGGGFGVAQLAGGREAGERGRARERERERGRRGREEGREREGGRETRGREVGERERAGERKTFLLPPLLATEAISVARRREEREERALPLSPASLPPASWATPNPPPVLCEELSPSAALSSPPRRVNFFFPSADTWRPGVFRPSQPPPWTPRRCTFD